MGAEAAGETDTAGGAEPELTRVAFAVSGANLRGVDLAPRSTGATMKRWRSRW